MKSRNKPQKKHSTLITFSLHCTHPRLPTSFWKLQKHIQRSTSGQNLNFKMFWRLGNGPAGLNERPWDFCCGPISYCHQQLAGLWPHPFQFYTQFYILEQAEDRLRNGQFIVFAFRPSTVFIYWRHKLGEQFTSHFRPCAPERGESWWQ